MKNKFNLLMLLNPHNCNYLLLIINKNTCYLSNTYPKIDFAFIELLIYQLFYPA